MFSRLPHLVWHEDTQSPAFAILSCLIILAYQLGWQTSEPFLFPTNVNVFAIDGQIFQAFFSFTCISFNFFCRPVNVKGKSRKEQRENTNLAQRWLLQIAQSQHCQWLCTYIHHHRQAARAEKSAVLLLKWVPLEADHRRGSIVFLVVGFHSRCILESNSFLLKLFWRRFHLL